MTPVQDKQEVVERLRAVSMTLRAMGVASIGFFGSFAAGHPTPQSDVDILVEFEPDKHTFDNFMELAFFLEQLLGRPVELVTREALSPLIGPHILREVHHVSLAA